MLSSFPLLPLCLSISGSKPVSACFMKTKPMLCTCTVCINIEVIYVLWSTAMARFASLEYGSHLNHYECHSSSLQFGALLHKKDCIVWLLLEEGVTNCSMSWETNDSFLMFNLHMKENSCYMSLSQGQASNTLARKGNHICFYDYRLFSLSSTVTSVTLHVCEFPGAFTHVEPQCWA